MLDSSAPFPKTFKVMVHTLHSQKLYNILQVPSPGSQDAPNAQGERARHVLSRPDRPAPATEREGGADWRRGRRLLPQRAPTLQDRRGDQQEGPRDHHVSRGAREAETRLRDIRHDFCVLKNIFIVLVFLALNTFRR